MALCEHTHTRSPGRGERRGCAGRMCVRAEATNMESDPQKTFSASKSTRKRPAKSKPASQKLVKSARRGRRAQKISILPKIRLFRLLKNGFAVFWLFASFFSILPPICAEIPPKTSQKPSDRPPKTVRTGTKIQKAHTTTHGQAKTAMCMPRA